jgi:hypothetical protein
MKHPALYFLILLSVYSCKKDKDTITTSSVNGQIYSLCNDSGLANVIVFLNINNSGGNSSLSTTSGANGNFSFNNVQIHSSSDYSYSLNVHSNGAGGYKPAIDGSTINIDKLKINQKQILNVVPHFNYWYLYFPNTLFTSNDTFVLTLQQNVFHSNFPSHIYQSISNCPCPITIPTHFAGGLSDYCMGRWQVTLDKTKNSIHTIKTDSFYIGWGATLTDTIPW